MIPADFRAALKTLGLTSREFSVLVEIHHATVSAWGKPYGHPIPAWVPLLLDAWAERSLLNESKKRATIP